jgi:hypothetical protein
MKRFSIFLAVALTIAVLGVVAHTQLFGALWIPLAMAAFVIGFPIVIVFSHNSLFEGLFDLDLSPNAKLPIRLFLVTFAAFAVSASAALIALLDLRCGPARYGVPAPHLWPWLATWVRAGTEQVAVNAWQLIAVVAAPAAIVAGFAIAVSWSQDRTRSFWRMIAGALLAIAAGAASFWLLFWARVALIQPIASRTVNSWLVMHFLGPGYRTPAWLANLTALAAFLMAFALYVLVGWHGRKFLGTPRTVPSLVAPLMSVLIFGWAGSATEFFLGRYHIPLLLVLAAWGLINSFIPSSDHTYETVPRDPDPAPTPFEVLTAGGRKRAIAVAATGGGIQAAAWTAQVLQGLSELHGPAFRQALCAISSVSGGSTGSALYVNWLDRGAAAALPTPFCAASASSLDEVAWGLAWPDMLRFFFPWPFGLGIDRAGALERAWIGNASGSQTGFAGQLQGALSGWNGKARTGELPAIIMNSTMVEVGGPLLLGTSDVNGCSDRASSVWKDGDNIHVERGVKKDVPVVRAARLSATFPFVTPAARPKNADHSPHMMDGGFYDNYGMATLTEWLDQALGEQSKKMKGREQVKDVLVIQINGFPREEFKVPPPSESEGGWALQAVAPVGVLVNVRTAGQVSHRDIELDLLRDKWRHCGITITSVTFELNEKRTPLSWHLMPKQIQSIQSGWEETTHTPSDQKVREAKQKVTDFLAGHAGLQVHTAPSLSPANAKSD